MISKDRLAGLKKLQRLLHYNFKNKHLLNQSLIHRSYAYEHTAGKIVDNERLEFLGDAVLGLAISDYLYGRFPRYQEGDMTRIRSALVSRSSLDNLARRLEIGEWLLLGKGEMASGGADQSSNLVGAYEAIIGALYLDGGFKKVSKFIEVQFKDEIKKVFREGAKKDYKSILQEYTSRTYRATPGYSVVLEEGPDHKKHFEIAVFFGGMVRGKGKGKNKKTAQQDAAYNALLNEGLLDKSKEEK